MRIIVSFIRLFLRTGWCVCDFMLRLLESYFTPPPLMCPVWEQRHGSLTCHIVPRHCLMIRECWRHSAASGVIKCCRGAAILPQICLGLWPRLSQASHFIFFSACSLSPPHLLFFPFEWSDPLSSLEVPLNGCMPSSIAFNVRKDWGINLCRPDCLLVLLESLRPNCVMSFFFLSPVSWLFFI